MFQPSYTILEENLGNSGTVEKGMEVLKKHKSCHYGPATRLEANLLIKKTYFYKKVVKSVNWDIQFTEYV